MMKLNQFGRFNLFWTICFCCVKLFTNFKISIAWKLSPWHFSCETYCPDPSLPHPDSLNYCHEGYNYYPPLIHHISSSRLSTNVFQMILSEIPVTGTTENYLEELILFGAIYLLPFQMQINRGKLRSPKPFRCDLATAKLPVPAQSYCRVHMNPRRYLDVYSYNWSSRILHVSDDIIVLDKPPGIPTSMTVDNAIENAMHQAALYLDSLSGSTTRPLPALHTTSRLDVCASGVLVFARSHQAASRINKEISQRRVKKKYTVLCQSNNTESNRSPPRGVLRHLFRRPTPSTAYLEISGSMNSNPASYTDENCLQSSDMMEVRSQPRTTSRDLHVSLEDKVRPYEEALLTGDGGEWQLAELVVTDVRRVCYKTCEWNSQQDKLMLKEVIGGSSTDLFPSHVNLFECSIVLVTVRAE